MPLSVEPNRSSTTNRSLLHEQFLEGLHTIEAENGSPSERMDGFIELYDEWIDDVVRIADNDEDDQEPLPLNLDKLSPGTFNVWLTSLKDENGKGRSKAYYAKHRSVLYDAFRDAGIEQTGAFTKRVGHQVTAIDKLVQDQKRHDGTSLTEGKEPMPFESVAA